MTDEQWQRRTRETEMLYHERLAKLTHLLEIQGQIIRDQEKQILKLQEDLLDIQERAVNGNN